MGKMPDEDFDDHSGLEDSYDESSDPATIDEPAGVVDLSKNNATHPG